MVGSIVASRNTWYWRSRWEFYIHIWGQWEETVRHWAWLEYMKPQSPSPVTHFLPQSHTFESSQTVPLCGDQVVQSMSLWGPFSFKPLQKHGTVFRLEELDSNLSSWSDCCVSVYHILRNMISNMVFALLEPKGWQGRLWWARKDWAKWKPQNASPGSNLGELKYT